MMLEQARQMKATADALISTLSPYVQEEAPEEEGEAYEEGEGEESLIPAPKEEGPMTKKPHALIIAALRKKVPAK